MHQFYFAMPKDRRIEVDSRREILRRQPPRRHQKVDGAPQGSHIPSVAPLKSKIHDLTRALQHNERMPADVRVEKERALAGYRKDLENAEKEKQKQLLIKRYHMVRFFGESVLCSVKPSEYKHHIDRPSPKSARRQKDMSRKPKKPWKHPRQTSPITDSYNKICMQRTWTSATPSTTL